MAKNDDGEFELVLGNRQLVSVFLIVVILLGVFFSMGYIVGRNSPAPATTTADAGTHPASGPPIVVDNPARQTPKTETAEPAPAARESTKPSPAPLSDNVPPVREAPRRVEPKPEPPKREPVVTASAEEPRAGQTFLQVVATSRPDAEIVAESLAKKGFRTSVAPGPTSALYRVLVGPVNGVADIAEMRVRLEAAGFKPYVRKY